MIKFTGVRRVTHEEGRRLEAEYWAGRSMAERVIAGWALAEDDLCDGVGMSRRSEQVELFAAFAAAFR